MMRVFLSVLLWAASAQAFSTVPMTKMGSTSTQLSMAQPDKDSDYMRWARQSRSAQADDNLVELIRPLGLILNQDEYGNVYVETVAPKGNAARTGKVKEGDIVTMCSATFGDEMWSCRGVGLNRVLAAIRVRSGPVKLVFESQTQYEKKKELTSKQIQAQADAAAAAQKKKDQLLTELEDTEQKLKKGKFLGLF
eukprot:CAMPEP_0172443956 /NCGR_PEP_ID=MMETSP1065-20121228/4137_1 /TAXON_ID=265537 /ORGANISM="Amphiprora paludosa, Strain CCMP125" /LENGTH=193 /DNA_ID=CAMNT_0013194369 /DNA_START=83 /DNA_END=664 /DNA_ORIENTATION=+